MKNAEPSSPRSAITQIRQENNTKNLLIFQAGMPSLSKQHQGGIHLEKSNSIKFFILSRKQTLKQQEVQ